MSLEETHALHALQPADLSVADSETRGLHLLEARGLTWGLEEVRRVLAKEIWIWLK